MCDVPVSFPYNFGTEREVGEKPPWLPQNGATSFGTPSCRNNLDMKAFRSFRLDPVNQCLWRGEHRVPLTPKAFDVLRYLVEHSGRLVTQDEILEALWPETYVNPELIKKYILGIRKVLGDRHDKPEFIETFPKRGYQFVAAVSDDVVVGSANLATGTTKTTMKMVGRDTALAELHNSLHRTLRGQRQVIFVTGEAGIGKTTLVDAFHQQAARNHTLSVISGSLLMKRVH